MFTQSIELAPGSLSEPKTGRRQGGSVLALAAIAMLVLIAFAALALDGGHMMLNKTRLQNAVDASTLSAAKVLDDTQDQLLAQQAAWNTFVLMVKSSGNDEIAEAFGAGIDGVSPPANFVVDFADQLFPMFACTLGCVEPAFVRVTVNDVALQPFFMVVLGLDDKEVGASAVSGPSPYLDHRLCDVVPILACGVADTDPEDGDFYGYNPDEIHVLKLGSGDESEVGPGNFQLLRLPGGQGGAALRVNLAGGYGGCLTTEEDAETEPGNSVGPVVQGLNTRIGEYSGPLDPNLYKADYYTEYPLKPTPELQYGDDGNIYDSDDNLVQTATDLLIDGVDYSYTGYDDWYQLNHPIDDNSGQWRRRILPVPIGDCSETVNGQGEVPIFGFACFFMLQPVIQQGTNAQIFGEFVEGCNANGYFSMDPGVTPSPTKIILYKNPDSIDS